MSKATNTQMIDTEPGGEQTQYEGTQTFVKRHAKSSGQFDDNETKTEAVDQLRKEKQERGEKTAENIRYGEAISEHGMGGETIGNSGKANQDVGYGGAEDDGAQTKQTRREQGYSEGSGVGA
ncbi:hypothetical protein B0J14DRAFT_137925 [Halenospora varia]|nr:hypothetical protein B0J14DRAFT_137925 [Halenospora varia]